MEIIPSRVRPSIAGNLLSRARLPVDATAVAYRWLHPRIIVERAANERIRSLLRLGSHRSWKSASGARAESSLHGVVRRFCYRYVPGRTMPVSSDAECGRWR